MNVGLNQGSVSVKTRVCQMSGYVLCLHFPLNVCVLLESWQSQFLFYSFPLKDTFLSFIVAVTHLKIYQKFLIFLKKT